MIGRLGRGKCKKKKPTLIKRAKVYPSLNAMTLGQWLCLTPVRVKRKPPFLMSLKNESLG
jgi:hypothetical protein